MERSGWDYVAVLIRYLPIALIGGLVSVLMRFDFIYKLANRKQKVIFAIVEYLIGAGSAMLCSTLFPTFFLIFPSTWQPSIEMEIGLCAFLGGSMGRGAFTFFQYHILKIGKNSELGGEEK